MAQVHELSEDYEKVIRREVVVQIKVRNKAVAAQALDFLRLGVYGIDEIWGLLSLGSRVRSVGSTSANE